MPFINLQAEHKVSQLGLLVMKCGRAENVAAFLDLPVRQQTKEVLEELEEPNIFRLLTF